MKTATLSRTKTETQPGPGLDRVLRTLPWLVSIVAIVFFAFYAVETRRWIVMWDGAVMHYVRFLITRGLRPYVDITDMNLPGSYLMEGWAMRLFGAGDAGWRVYECFLMLVLAAGCIVIAGRERWLAGVYPALLFLLLHGAEGPMMAVERDEVMTVLLVLAVAACFTSLRSRTAVWMLPFGLLAGLACGLKPGAVLFAIGFPLLAACVVWRRRAAVWPYLGYALLGELAMAAVMLGFLLHYRALGHLFFVARHVLPYYLREKNHDALYLLSHLLPALLWPLVALGVAAACVRWRSAGWERAGLVLAALCGLLSYWIQRKGYLYHRYTFTVFVLLWAAWEWSGSRQSRRVIPALLELTAAALALCWIAPAFAYQLWLYPRITPPPQALALGLEQDLQALQSSGESLENEVQCFDLVNGCLNALYRLRLVQNTGTTGDLLLFAPVDGPAVAYYRQWFATREMRHPPVVVVLGNEYYHQVETSFDKIDTWPAYAAYLRSHYTPVVERHFGEDNEPAYRLYLRDGSALLQWEQLHPLKARAVTAQKR